MADYTHVYAVLEGAWVPSSVWDGEIGQMGLRVGAWPSPTSPDPLAALPIRTCELVTETHDEADASVFQGFQGSGGGLGTPAWTYPDQLGLATAILAFMNAIKPRVSSKFAWNRIKLSPIAPDGKNAAGPTVFSLKTPLVGTDSGQSLPPQNSVALSFVRRIPGRRGRGRMFIPAVGSGSITPEGQLGGTANAAYRDAGKGLDTAIKAMGGGTDWEYRLVVTSAASANYVLPAEVRVGNIVDTQRRRRNAIRETFTSDVLT